MNSLIELENEFIKHLSKDLVPNTIKSYKSDLNTFNDYINAPTLPTFTTENALDYTSYLEKKYMAANSIRRKIQAVRMFFDYLQTREILTSNPLKVIKAAPKVLALPNPSSLSDLKILWNSLSSQYDASFNFEQLLLLRNITIFLLIFDAGLQVSELEKLNKTDLNLKNDPRILITRRNRDAITIPIMPVSTLWIRKYIHTLNDYTQKHDLKFGDLFFCANHYQIITKGLTCRGIELVFKEFSKNFKITITPKSLRQAAILNWINTGKPASLIIEWLGVAPEYDLTLYQEAAKNYIIDNKFITSPKLQN